MNIRLFDCLVKLSISPPLNLSINLSLSLFLSLSLSQSLPHLILSLTLSAAPAAVTRLALQGQAETEHVFGEVQQSLKTGLCVPSWPRLLWGIWVSQRLGPFGTLDISRKYKGVQRVSALIRLYNCIERIQKSSQLLRPCTSDLLDSSSFLPLWLVSSQPTANVTHK